MVTSFTKDLANLSDQTFPKFATAEGIIAIPAWKDGKMKQTTLHIASGVSVLVTTLTYGYSMYRTMAHLVAHHGQGLSNPFFAVHTILAAAAGVLSLIGAYFLLTGWRQQNAS